MSLAIANALVGTSMGLFLSALSLSDYLCKR
jgi:hypothetical protein